jgi:hypothetical protein
MGQRATCIELAKRERSRHLAHPLFQDQDQVPRACFPDHVGCLLRRTSAAYRDMNQPAQLLQRFWTFYLPGRSYFKQRNRKSRQ